MALFELKMPKLGESVTEGTIGKWLKRPGDAVAKYDLLVEVQTDKVNTEIPSPVAGTLKEVKVEEGTTVAIGTLLAVFETADEAVQAAPAPSPTAPAAPAPSPAAPSVTTASAVTAVPPPTTDVPATTLPQPSPAAPAAVARPDLSDVRATPAVRRLAAEHAIDLSQVTGTGLGGRVSKQDVEAYLAAPHAAPPPAPATPPSPAAPSAPAQAAVPATPAAPAPTPPPVQAAQAAAPAAQTAPVPPPTPAAPAPQAPLVAKPTGPAPLPGDQTLPLTQMRRAIAENMVRSWSAPHAHAVMEIDMTAVMRYRDAARGEFIAREGFDLSPAAFVMKAAVEALRAVPLVNAGWTTEGIRMHRAVNLGYAVALGDDGLVVPVIRAADGLSIAGLMRAIRDIVDRAKARRLTFDDFAGGTFTVNNTGPLGTIVSSPIVPPGQAAIVSSEAITKRLVVTGEDQIAIRQMMNLVIGFDHRVVDGATAAKFLATMRGWLEGVTAAVPVY